MKRVFSLLVIFVLMAGTFLFAQSYKGTTIRVLVWDDALTVAVESMIDEFEKETGIDVIFERLPSGSILEKTAVSISQNRTDYDLVSIDEPFVPQFGDLFIPYSQWPQGKVYPKIDLERDLIPGVPEGSYWDGSYRGLPINGNVYVWMTRKDIVNNEQYKKEFQEKYGYELDIPQNFDQLLEMSEFLSNKGIYGFAPFTKSAEGATAEAILMFESYGTKVLEQVGEHDFEVVLDREKAIEALNMYKALCEFAPPGWQDMGHSERIAAFNQGKVFSMFQWPAIIPDHENPDQSLVSGRIYYSAPPAGPVRRAPVRGTWMLGIPKASKNKEAAAEFAYWWSSYEAGKELVKVGLTPARTDLLLDPKFIEQKPYFVGIFNSMRYSVSRPRFERYAEVSDVIKVNWLAGVTGRVTPETAIDNMIKGIDEVLGRYGY
ncbi:MULTISPECIES: extracellular solute-binding protein [Petrotoga]|uniref:Carbohydrate ABC transporter substrate-binding protein (CUT1 family) n=2 Tax=Petrotoga sibirica TaxID=156202 RepID=A0A4R8EQN7_9BACT|nr:MULTISPECIES: extracellular solute-binding protein [Petrotoga]POZ89197.1 ABC transporter substrate-binding protein [Petrotoga sibirica DSM 13575]POZ91501.1 ABC transporter substrate-binding protein [Petrotoga sp. SL27]TDX12868.1 carbohydrate ABC transporter substrate-binding protein (CUT1 family) [Petrotoga sibirica]